MKKYTTAQGDMYDAIAKKLYKNEGFAGHLITANPENAHTVLFSAGVVLNVPDLPAPSAPDNLPPWRKRS